MEITIAGHRITLYNEVNINLKFDCIADTFGFRLYFNPDSVTDKKIFRPLTYYPCTITHDGVLVMTGTVLMHSFMSAGDPPKQLVFISGYSKTGVLGDSCLLNTTYKVSQVENGGDGGISIAHTNPDGSLTLNEAALQFDGMKLVDIVRATTSWYELGEPVVDKELAKDPLFNAPYTTVLPPKRNADDYRDTSVAEFLDMLCKQKNVILSHTADGHLLLTRQHADKLLTTSSTIVSRPANETAQARTGVTQIRPAFGKEEKTTSADRKVLYSFTDNDPVIRKNRQPDGTWTGMTLDFNGQALHAIIQVVGEQNDDNAADTAIVNPYVGGGAPRYTRLIQTSGTDNDTPLTARSAIKDELKNIVLTIDIHGWKLAGHLVTPNQLITVTNKELYLYGVSTWFIQEVSLFGDVERETATLICVLPECFNNDTVKNRLF